MPKVSELPYIVKSRGWAIRKAKEGELGHRITDDEIIRATKAQRATVRKLTAEPDAEIDHTSVGFCISVAKFFDVPLFDAPNSLLYVEPRQVDTR